MHIYIKNSLDFLWKIRNILIISLLSLCSTVVILFSFVRQPLIAEIIPQDGLMWYISFDIPAIDSKKHSYTIPFFDLLHHVSQGAISIEENQRIIRQASILEFEDYQDVVLLSPYNIHDLWYVLRSSFSLPEQFEEKKVYEYQSEDQRGGIMIYKNHIALSQDPQLLTFIATHEKPLSQSSTYNNSLIRQYRNKNFEGFIDMEKILYQHSLSLDETKKTVYESVIQNIGTQLKISFDGIYDPSGIQAKLSLQENGQTSLYQYSTSMSKWISHFSSGDIQFSGSGFSQSLETLLSTHPSYQQYINTYNDFLLDNVDVDFSLAITKWLQYPYTLRMVYDDEQQKFQYGFVLGMPLSDNDIEYIESGFLRYALGLKPTRQTIVLEDGTVGEEYIIDTDTAIQKQSFMIDTYQCRQSSLVKPSHFQFIVCRDNTLTLFATSLAGMQNIVYDIPKNPNTVEVLPQSTTIKNHFIDVYEESFQTTIGETFTEFLQSFESIDISLGTDQTWKVELEWEDQVQQWEQGY